MSTPDPLPPLTAPTRLPQRPWFERLNLLNVTLLLFLLAVIFSGAQIEGSERNLDVWQNLLNFLKDFFPPDLSVIPQTGVALLETIKIAILSTFFAIIVSLLCGLGAARTISPNWLVVGTRMLLNLVRTIPSLIWAVIAVAAMGANAAAGVAALTFYSTGYLGKFFSEAFESVDLNVARSLQGIGADSVQAFQYGIWPHAKPLIWSHSIWMLEYNIRSASIIGYVGAGGLGLQLHAYQEFHHWDRFSTVLFCILLVVTLLDLLSERIRQRIARRLPSDFAESE
ncbi:MAG: phosphonate ABC transporter, permease protein PhnE [Opitutales bacterium]